MGDYVEETDHADIDIPAVEPIPVRITGSARNKAADFGGLATYSYSANATVDAAAIKILPYAETRHRAVVNVVAGTAGHSVRIGTQGQIANGQGGTFPVGTSITLENNNEWWMVAGTPGTTIATVTVLDEQYR